MNRFDKRRRPSRAAAASPVKNSESGPALSPTGASRRRFLTGTGALTTGAAATPYLATAFAPGVHARTSEAAVPSAARDSLTDVRLTVNGRDYQLRLDPRVTLLDAVREYLGLKGTKKGCDRGQCGACTVLVNGRRINSCLTLALSHEGDKIVTIEGLGSPAALHPVQKAFLERDAFQCGYCTPGQICSAVALLDEARAGTASAATRDVRASGPVALSEDEIRERMSGNICRCGAYVHIVAAIRDAAGRTTT